MIFNCVNADYLETLEHIMFNIWTRLRCRDLVNPKYNYTDWNFVETEKQRSQNVALKNASETLEKKPDKSYSECRVRQYIGSTSTAKISWSHLLGTRKFND